MGQGNLLKGIENKTIKGQLFSECHFSIFNFAKKIYKLSKTNTFFSRFEGTRGEKNPNISHLIPFEHAPKHVLNAP